MNLFQLPLFETIFKTNSSRLASDDVGVLSLQRLGHPLQIHLLRVSDRGELSRLVHHRLLHRGYLLPGGYPRLQVQNNVHGEWILGEGMFVLYRVSAE